MEYRDITAGNFEKPVDDYLRVATSSPEIAIADIPFNVRSIGEAYEQAKAEQAELVVMPELCLTGYSAADLFHNEHVLEQTEIGLSALAEQTLDGPAMVVGAPLRHEGLLFNCAVMLAEGKISGAVPKTRLPSYREFYEYRWFTSGRGVDKQEMQIGSQTFPFGTDILFNINSTKVGVEICEDMFAGIPPGRIAALMGAEVVVNLSASNEVIGKDDYRRTLISAFTGSLICGYVYASAGRGESVADVIYGGHQIISENARIQKERVPFETETAPLVHDIDRTYLQHDRLVNKTYAEEAAEMRAEKTYRTITLSVPKPTDDRLLRFVDPYPFVPSNPETLDMRCEQIFNKLAHALAQRIIDSGAEALVLGKSGGSDSTLALLTGMYACDLLGKPYSFIHTITMPGPASSERTQENASRLAAALGTTHQVIPISELTFKTLELLGHDQVTEDLTFENTQARLRTSAILMNYANKVNGFVEGTGDFSENSIGWCTFNGDQTSMFNPNSNIPKTLVKHLISWYAEHRASDDARAILRDILATPISPELVGKGDLSQTTEDIVGSYALIDFDTYQHLRYGSRPTKIGYLATVAFQRQEENLEQGAQLDTFLRRFTNSQWKRDVMPNGTKVGTVALSPRGDLRMAPNTSINWYK